MNDNSIHFFRFFITRSSHQRVGQLSVICEEEQPTRFSVKSANMGYWGESFRKNVENGWNF
jgi:hypothetical protein